MALFTLFTNRSSVPFLLPFPFPSFFRRYCCRSFTVVKRREGWKVGSRYRGPLLLSSFSSSDHPPFFHLILAAFAGSSPLLLSRRVVFRLTFSSFKRYRFLPHFCSQVTFHKDFSLLSSSSTKKVVVLPSPIFSSQIPLAPTRKASLYIRGM